MNCFIIFLRNLCYTHNEHNIRETNMKAPGGRNMAETKIPMSLAQYVQSVKDSALVNGT